MTIASSTTRDSYTTDGTSTVFPVNIQAYQAADFLVTLTSAAGGETNLVLGSAYNMASTGTLTPPMWSLTTTGAPLAAGQTLQIILSPAQNQETVYVQGQSFPSAAVQANMDRLTQMVLNLQDQVKRCIRAPQADASPNMALPASAQRSLLWQAYDVNGNSTLVTALPAGVTLSTATLAPFLGLSQTGAEVTALVTPTNLWADSGAPVIDVRRYGAVLDGATNDYAAIVKACQVAGVIGGRVLISAFAAIASASLAIAPLPILSNTELIGIGRGASGIIITGTSVCHLANPQNVSNVRVADLSITGNSQANASQVGECFYFQSTSAATANTGNIRIERCTFSNFQGDYWLEFDNISGTSYVLHNIWIKDNVFLSQSGNARGGSNIGIPSCFIMLRGSATNTTALVRDVWINDNYALGTYIKTFVVSWESTLHVYAFQNTLDSFGQSGISLNCGAYAMLAYNNSSNDGGPGGADPDHIYYFFNRIISPLSCGIYNAQVNRVFYKGNKISGQSDTNDGSIPKGAIAINGASYAEVDDNEFDGNFACIELTPSTSVAIMKARNNRGLSSVANAVGIKFTAGYAGQVDTFECTGNDMVMTGTNSNAVVVNVTATLGIGRLIVKHNPRLSATTFCLKVTAPDASVPALTYVEIEDNTYVGIGATTACSYNSASNAATRATLVGNKYTGTWATAAVLLDIRSSLGLTVKNEEFNDLTAGTIGTTVAVSSAGAQGRMEGCRFNNVGTNYRYLTSANWLGGTLPNWTGNANDFVQDLNPTELGSSSSKYTRQGWQWDTTNAAWKEVRALTGN